MNAAGSTAIKTIHEHRNQARLALTSGALGDAARGTMNILDYTEARAKKQVTVGRTTTTKACAVSEQIRKFLR
mgnify:CR=1 FL=1